MTLFILFCISFIVIDTVCYASAPYPERDKAVYKVLPGGGMIAYIVLEKKTETDLDNGA